MLPNYDNEEESTAVLAPESSRQVSEPMRNAGDGDIPAPLTGELIKIDTFPSKTHHMIEQCHKYDPETACWNAEGTVFHVSNSERLANSYLPQYFKHSNFQSFIRQLNLYGFRSIRQPRDGNDSPPDKRDSRNQNFAFRNEFFLKDRRDLLSRIQRAKRKPPKDKAANGSTSRSQNKKEQALAKALKKDRESPTRSEIDSATASTSAESNDLSQSWNCRFDSMDAEVSCLGRKMDVIAGKLDRLIALMTFNGGFPKEVKVLPTNTGRPQRTKKQKSDTSSVSSSENVPTVVSKSSNNSSDGDPSSPRTPFSKMNAWVEEEGSSNSSDGGDGMPEVDEYGSPGRRGNNSTRAEEGSIGRMIGSRVLCTRPEAVSSSGHSLKTDDYEVFVNMMLDDGGGGNASPASFPNGGHSALPNVPGTKRKFATTSSDRFRNEDVMPPAEASPNDSYAVSSAQPGDGSHIPFDEVGMDIIDGLDFSVSSKDKDLECPVPGAVSLSVFDETVIPPNEDAVPRGRRVSNTGGPEAQHADISGDDIDDSGVFHPGFSAQRGDFFRKPPRSSKFSKVVIAGLMVIGVIGAIVGTQVNVNSGTEQPPTVIEDVPKEDNGIDVAPKGLPSFGEDMTSPTPAPEGSPTGCSCAQEVIAVLTSDNSLFECRRDLGFSSRF